MQHIGLVAVLALLASAVVGPAAEPSCPRGLTMWETIGAVEENGQWSVRVLRVDGELALFRSMTLRLGDAGLSGREARWFVAPEALEVVGLAVVTLQLVGDELVSLCRELDAMGLGTMRELARPRCYIENGKKTLTLVEYSVSLARGGLYLPGTSGLDENADCEPAPPKGALPHMKVVLESKDPAAPLSEKTEEILLRLDHPYLPADTGMTAIPAARQVLATLRERGEDEVPANLPSELLLMAAVGPRNLVEATALEHMMTGRPQEQEVALKVLGDRPAPNTAHALRMRLRNAVAGNEDRVVSLSVRALLHADRRAARLEAVNLFREPAHARAALGVFALTSPELREDLEVLDLADPRAVREAVGRVLRHLEASAPEEEVREAARSASQALQGR